ncbi:Hydrogen cyanide synthase subunit HcnB [Enhygromyxa salina]|uniref:Hydrogen cyanide synthase subunit HcnB n=1 Tax=Enhygromyxa salina TaxID=215803 RepID=A0A2S9XDC9_9BACT|nr:(2Fe-2S)-binding protein [Enhygromyxa salina]PRP90857.1 Hydrogen cyanide synthase subunit HcnB [Enhygromyxa salina]
MTDRSFVCRCEDVSKRELDHAFAAGLTTIEEIKRYTGFGTGPCQGKECMAAVARELIRRGLAEPHELQPFTARPPTEPVSFGALATAPDPFADPEPSSAAEEATDPP